MSVRVYKVSHFSSILEKAGPMLTAPHTGIAWRFKLLSLSLPYPRPRPHAPPTFLLINLPVWHWLLSSTSSLPSSLPPPFPTRALGVLNQVTPNLHKTYLGHMSYVEFTKLVHRKKLYFAQSVSCSSFVFTFVLLKTQSSFSLRVFISQSAVSQLINKREGIHGARQTSHA